MHSETIKVIVSYWGAIIATSLAIIKLVEFTRDKAKVKVSANLIFRPIDEHKDCKGTRVQVKEEGFSEILLRVLVVNSGRRSIQITSILIENSAGGILQVIPTNFPAVLQPLTSIDAEIQKEWIDKETVTLFGVTDALGNKYSIESKSLQQLLQSTNSYPTNKKKYRRKDGTGEEVTAFQVKDKSIVISREVDNK